MRIANALGDEDRGDRGLPPVRGGVAQAPNRSLEHDAPVARDAEAMTVRNVLLIDIHRLRTLSASPGRRARRALEAAAIKQLAGEPQSALTLLATATEYLSCRSRLRALTTGLGGAPGRLLTPSLLDAPGKRIHHELK
jgi:hypothetical protein